MELVNERCVPCKEGTPAMGAEEAHAMATQVPAWTVHDTSIERQFTFANFPEAMAFVNRVAALAESEGHHPDMHIYYNTVKLELSTHKVGGLSRNDFILAAKIDRVVNAER